MNNLEIKCPFPAFHGRGSEFGSDCCHCTVILNLDCPVLSDFLCLPEQPVRQTVLVGRHFMITDAVPDRVLKSGHNLSTRRIFSSSRSMVKCFSRKAMSGSSPGRQILMARYFKSASFKSRFVRYWLQLVQTETISAKNSAEAVVTTALDALSRR